MTLRALVESPEYVKTARAVLKGTGFRLCKSIYDVEFEIVDKELKAASMTLEQLRRNLADDACLDFCRRYIVSGDSLDFGQEYNPAEPPEPEEPSNEKYLGHSHTYLISAAVVYAVATERPAELLPYLKATRTPHASKVAAALKRFLKVPRAK